MISPVFLLYEGNLMQNDNYFMEQAVELGRLGMNMTSPNPRVGCILVKDGKVIGSGYHREYGGAHAEIEAIDSSKRDISGSTLFVTLEPCSHYGKTPPCTQRILKEGIERVVVGVEDVNEAVKGIEILRENGVEVETGILKDKAADLIKDYLEFSIRKKPYITVKAAMSWDGKTATRTGDSQWISSKESREYTMKLRGMQDAVLVGVNTVNCDNPELTYRLHDPLAKQPLRVVLDLDLKIETDKKILNKNTVIITHQDSDKVKKRKIEATGAEIIEMDGLGEYIPSEKIVNYLYKRGIMSVLIEGGGTAASSFINSRLVNKVIFVYASIIIGGKGAPTACDGQGIDKLNNAVELSNIRRFESGGDLIMEGELL